MAQSEPFSSSSEDRDPADRDEVAAYISEMSTELAVMARRSGLEIVAYLLEMVQLEASGVVLREPAVNRRPFET